MPMPIQRMMSGRPRSTQMIRVMGIAMNLTPERVYKCRKVSGRVQGTFAHDLSIYGRISRVAATKTGLNRNGHSPEVANVAALVDDSRL
jgi:hypothetical protein